MMNNTHATQDWVLYETVKTENFDVKGQSTPIIFTPIRPIGGEVITVVGYSTNAEEKQPITETYEIVIPAYEGKEGYVPISINDDGSAYTYGGLGEIYVTPEGGIRFLEPTVEYIKIIQKIPRIPIISSPSGKKFKIVVDDAGKLSTELFIKEY